MYVNPYSSPSPLALKLRTNGKQVGLNLVPKMFQAGPTFSEPVAGKTWTDKGVTPLNTYLKNGTKQPLPKTGGPTVGGEAGGVTPGLPAGAPPRTEPASPANDNPSADPVMDEITALYHKRYQDSIVGADAQRKQLAIALGDPEFANQMVFGGLNPDEQHVGDKNTALAAANNPYSLLKLRSKAFGQELLADDEAKNNQNLFYGGAREKSQTQLGDQNNQTIAGYYGDTRSKLEQLLSGIRSAWDTEQQKESEQRIAKMNADAAKPLATIDTSTTDLPTVVATPPAKKATTVAKAKPTTLQTAMTNLRTKAMKGRA